MQGVKRDNKTGLVCGLFAALFFATIASAQDLVAPSVVRADQEAVLSSLIVGQIAELPFDEGDAFRSGQMLVEIDCAVLASQAQAALAESAGKTAFADARDALLARGGTGQLDVDAARADALAALARAKAAKQRVGYCRIDAPYDGRVVERLVSRYEFVEPGKPLLSIVSTGRPDLEIIAPADWLQWVRSGTSGLLMLEATGKEVGVSVRGIGPTVDPVSRTIVLSADLVGDVAGILPGMSGLVRLERPE